MINRMEMTKVKITKFKDIPQLTKAGSYNTNIPLTHMLKTISEWEQDEYYQLQLNPNFQRGHVWTESQQIAFVEFLLRGGKSARVIYFNKPSWQMTKTINGYDDFVCVDGLQRITAVTKFLKNEIKEVNYLLSKINEHNFKYIYFLDDDVNTISSVINSYYTGDENIKAEILQEYC